MEKDKCIECDSKLKRIKFPKGRIWMKCLNRDCSLCYILTEVSNFDIGRWMTRGKEGMKKKINRGDVQVFFFFFII
jgi:hypothetical protein